MDFLIIPLALVLGGFFLNRSEKRRELEAAQERANVDREIVKIRNEEVAVSEYIDAMSELILEKRFLLSK